MKPVRIAILALTAVPVVALANPIEIRRNAIVKVSMDQTISLRDNQEGDKFSATVVDDRDLPTGTKFVGRIMEIHRPEGKHPGTVELRFRRLVMPNGESAEINAVPVRWNLARRDRDGHFYLSEDKPRKENYVLGGLIGGGLIGSLLKKPFEGAMIGTFAGILAAESADSASKEQVAIHRGDTFGALIKDDFVMDSNQYGRRRHHRSDDQWTPGYGGRVVGHVGDSAPRDSAPVRGESRDNNSPIQIGFEDRTLSFSEAEQPYRNGDTVMVPVTAISKELKVDVEQASSGKIIYLENDTNSARLELDNRDYRLNGATASFGAPVEKKGDVLFVPIDVFAKLKVGRVTINGTDLR